jgi:UDP-N-acetylmuramyl-tripeptide synthetase
MPAAARGATGADRSPGLLLFRDTIGKAAAAGVRTLALEVTSLALAEGFAERWPADVAVFTNLTRDHLDLHGSPEANLAAKAQRFRRLVPGGAAVLNRDDPASLLLKEVLAPTTRVLEYSLAGQADLAAQHIALGIGETVVTLAPGPLADRLGGRLQLATTGRVNVANALGGALAAFAAGYDAPAILRGLAGFTGARGRFERVRFDGEAGGPVPRVFVDYAHTSDGLENTLRSARALLMTASEATRGRLLCVFGCGGGGDPGKRPLMGQTADALADVVVLTADNPRNETPEGIAAAILAGVPAPRATWIVEHDRATAIARALAFARDSLRSGREDLVVIAGKGHETVQVVGTERRPFDDVAVAKAAFARLRGTT